MKLHEFQSKEILSRFGLTSPAGGVAITPEQNRSSGRGPDSVAWVGHYYPELARIAVAASHPRATDRQRQVLPLFPFTQL